MSYLVKRLAQLGMVRVQVLNSSSNTMFQGQLSNKNARRMMTSMEDPSKNQGTSKYTGPHAGVVYKYQIGENVSRKDKIKFLISTLLDLKDSKEEVYGALDAWVAWEQNFPIASLKLVLISLEKEHQWHRVVQVIKWMLSKGQGTTMGTYGQLVRALDMDHRAEEAHKFWMKRIGSDLHSVTWQLCHLMISVYYRNNMLGRLIKLFQGLEAFDRKPPDKTIVQKVANAYEMLGLLEEKNRLMEKYNDLFTDSSKGKPKTSRTSSSKKKKKSGPKTSDIQTNAADGYVQTCLDSESV